MVPDDNNTFLMYIHHEGGTDYVETRIENNGSCAVTSRRQVNPILCFKFNKR